MFTAFAPTATYASDGNDNYLCATPMKTAQNYPLPCRASRDDWSFSQKKEFVITAWWPPNLMQLDDYVAAHFNLVLMGNLAGLCVERGTIPQHPTYDDVFRCQLQAFSTIAAAGLKIAWAPSGYQHDPTDYALGNAFGGIFENAPNGHYPTTPEVAYAVGEFRRRKPE